MTTHQTRAQHLFEHGCQCAQSTFGALCDVTGMDEKDALAISASFGGGIGRMREICGALSGLLMAIGMTMGRYDTADSAAKDRHYRLTQYAALLFKRKVGSIYCYRLLDLPHGAQIPVSTPRSPTFYQTRPCTHIIFAAVDVFDELLEQSKNGTLDALLTEENAEQVTKELNRQN